LLLLFSVSACSDLSPAFRPPTAITIRQKKKMSVVRPNTSLVAKAISVYLSYSLQAALQFKSKLDSCHCTVGEKFWFLFHADSYQRLEELVQYLQESICKPTTLYSLAGRLAVIDRLKNSVSWSVLGGTPSHQWGTAHEMCKRSADFIRFSMIAEEQNDLELSKEWIVASKISDLASQMPKQRSESHLPNYQSLLSGKQTLNLGRIEQMQFISGYIVALLAEQPPVLPRGTKAVSDQYKEKIIHLEELADAVLALKRDQLSLTPQDERIQCMYVLQRYLIDHALAQLTDGRVPLRELIQHHKARDAELEQIAELRKRVGELLTALNACQKLLAGTRQADCADSKAQLGVLGADVERLLHDIRAACEEAQLHTPVRASSTMSTRWLQLRDDAGQQLISVLKVKVGCQHVVERTKYTAFYTAEAERSAHIRPYTRYQQKITECWERAVVTITAAVDPDVKSFGYRHWQYATLAEGIFASVVTCHTQWERAVQRRDDKLADFWQRARERAWEVGCKTFQDLQWDIRNPTVNYEILRVVNAVRQVTCAQELLSTANAYPLAAAEADLRLLLADMLVAYGPDSKNTPSHRQLIRHTTKLALATIAAFYPSTDLGLLDVLPAATATEEVHVSLRWCARVLCDLHHLSRSDASPHVAQAWHGVNNQIRTILTELQAESGEPCDSTVLTQRKFVAELMMKQLECRCRNEAAAALGLEWLASAYASVLPEGKFLDALTKATRPRIVKFRLQLARALELEVAAASVEIAQWLKSQWPLERRGFPAFTNRGAKSPDFAPAITSTMDAYRSAVQWKQQSQAEGVTAALKLHLEDGSARWAALADHRIKLAEHAEHGKVEDAQGNIFAKQALAARGEGREMAVRAMEAGLRALQDGNTEAHKVCVQVCKDFTPLTTQDSYIYVGTKKSLYQVRDIELAVAQIMLFADHSLRAVTAELDGRASLATAWREAAQAREKGLTRYNHGAVVYTRRYGITDIVKRADALAEEARLLEVGAESAPAASVP
jgi:hypothetical protein